MDNHPHPLSPDERALENRRKLRKHLRHTPRIVFCVRDEAAPDLEADIETIAIAGPCLLFYENASFGNGQQYLSPALASPTWLEICKRVEDALKRTEDFSHDFLESAYCVGSSDDGVPVYTVFMGS